MLRKMILAVVILAMAAVPIPALPVPVPVLRRSVLLSEEVATPSVAGTFVRWGGTRPGCSGMPGFRSRSNEGPRKRPGAAGSGPRAGAVALARLASAAGTGEGRAPATGDLRQARRQGSGALGVASSHPTH